MDTHTALWFFKGDEALSKIAKHTILDTSNIKYLSMTSAWELAIKISIGKLSITGNAEGFVRLAENNGFTIIPIKTFYLTVLESLPMICQLRWRRDPFDRLLIATAIAEQMTLITADENIARYDVLHIW